MEGLTKLTIWMLLSVLAICKGLTDQGNDEILMNLNRLEDELVDLKDELAKYTNKDASNVNNVNLNDGVNDKILVKDLSTKDVVADDVKRSKEDENYRLRCGFQDDCIDAFKIEDTNPLKWAVKSYSPQDRTDSHGRFLQVEVKKENTKDQYAFFSHEFTQQKTEQCGEFYYHMYNREGCDVARLLVTIQCEDEQETEILMRETGNRHDKWHRAQVSIVRQAGKKCKLTWRVSKGLSDGGKVSIDDITMYFEPCRKPDQPVFPSQAECSFINNFCEWKETGIVKWKIYSWRTPTRNTGPNRYFGTYERHTYGRYIFLEADTPDAEYTTTKLTSPKMKSSIDQCLRFMYHMYGADMGSLDASITSDGVSKSVFQKSGDQGNQWHEGKVDLPANQINEVVFSAKMGNGSLSDIALSNIIVQHGSCFPRKALAQCSETDQGCSYTYETCGEEIKEFKRTEVHQLKRGEYLTTIPKVSKEWELSLDINLKGRINGWTSVIRMTSTGTTGWKIGDRIPAIFLFTRSNRMHITTQIDWNGNWANNNGYLVDNKYTTVRVAQKKEADEKYYFSVYINGIFKGKQLNRMPAERRNVKIFAGDAMHNPANAEVKNIIFKNTGSFTQCNEVCNTKLSSEAFKNLKPAPAKTYPAFTLKKGTLIDTIPTIAKQWYLSFEIKPKGKLGGWSNIIHFTSDGHNCCRPGRRIPGIWFIHSSTKLHITNTIDNNGNYPYSSPDIEVDKFTKVIMQQKMVGQNYEYSINVNGQVVHSRNNTIPREFLNVKFYGSDPWYNAANAEIKNFEFKNLVSTYPCKDLCKTREEEQIIDGAKTRAVIYEQKYCKDRTIVFEGIIAPTLRLTRGSCLTFYYKFVGDGNFYCYLDVKLNQAVHIDHIRIYNSNTKSGEWKKFQKIIVSYIGYGSSNRVVGIKSSINGRCPHLEFAKLSLLDGVC